MILPGLLSWLLAGLAAFALARLVASQRRDWLLEIVVAVLAALIAGFSATAMNFAGIQVLEPTAIAFVAICSAAAIALVRLIPSRRQSTQQ